MDTVAALLRELLLGCFLYCILHRLAGRLLLGRSRRRLPPGPRGFPIVGALPLLGRAPHVALARLARRYGPVMYLNYGRSGVVVASTPAAARVFLRTLDAHFADRPVDAAPVHLAYGAQNLAFVRYGPRWKLLRRVCNVEMLGARALGAWSRVRREEVGAAVRAMRAASAKGEAVVVADVTAHAMGNMVGRVVVGRPVFEGGPGPESREFREMVVELMTMAGLTNVGDFVPGLAWLDLQGLRKAMGRLHRRFDAMLSEMVKEHERTADSRRGKPDLLDVLMANREDAGGERLTDDGLKAILLDLFAAGTDTSSSTIEWAVAEMLANPAILKRAQAEMDRVVGRDRRLEESDVPSLPYLRAICKEAFRKHPSTPLNLPRISTQPCEVDGYWIPKNTRLLVNIWAIGRDPAVWANPHEFDPGRFMTPEGSRIEPGGNDFELIPFGAGRRICAGARMAVVVVEYVLGSMIHAFDWRLPDGVELGMDETFGIALQKTEPVSVMVSPRLAPHAYAD